MSEASEIRLVRCPKCENLLQEPSEFSVYQCGGCGTVLRAKKKGLVDNGDLDVSDEEMGSGVPDKVDDNATALVDDLREEKAKQGIESGDALDNSVDETGTFNSNNPLLSGNRGAATDLDVGTRLAKRMGFRPDQNRMIGISNDRFGHSSDVPNGNWVEDSGNARYNVNRAAYADSRFESEPQEFMLREGSLRSRPLVNSRNLDSSRLVSSLSNANDVAGKRGFVNFSYPDIGVGSYGTYTEQAKYEDRLDRLARVEILENDRAELLRKLDELTDQLTRSCNVADEPRETRFHDRKMPPASTKPYDRNDAVKQPGTSMSYGVSKQPIVFDQPVSGHSYMPHGYASYMGRNGSTFLESYPNRNHMQEYRGYGDVYHPHMLRRPPCQQPNKYMHDCQQPNKYMHESCYEHFPAQCLDFNRDRFMAEPHETFCHKPMCSCMHPLDNNLYVPRKSQPPILSSQNDRNNYANRIPCSHVNPAAYGPQGYISEESNLALLHPHDRHHLTRSSSDLGVETSGFGRWRLKKPTVTKRDRHVFHPIAGGAPFITCCNCSQVLKMSRKFIPMQEKQNKIKCEACSSVLLFELEKKGVVLSIPAEAEEVFVDVSAATCATHGQNFQHPHGFLNTGATDISDEYENRNCDSSKDVESNTVLGARMSNSDVGEIGHDPHSFSSVASEDESSPNSMIAGKNLIHSSKLISKDEASLHLPDSPCDKYLDKPSSDSSMDREGSESKVSDQGKIFTDGKTSRQNSLKDALVATEMDFSYDDSSTNAVRQYSSDVNKDNDQPKINKGAESFFTGLIKKSFGDFSRSRQATENRRSNVSVNGHFIPDRVVKKAEKLAGPIQPGDYWYDCRAGFWGVMGHPCLGIILPSIDEFNYPMPENCAGGNTEIFLNGRELHQKDLDLLASRGLPTTWHKSYLIEISGKIVDEDTGEELDLGKLAPTVERAKHGFGMKVPKTK